MTFQLGKALETRPSLTCKALQCFYSLYLKASPQMNDPHLAIDGTFPQIEGHASTWERCICQGHASTWERCICQGHASTCESCVCHVSSSSSSSLKVMWNVMYRRRAWVQALPWFWDLCLRLVGWGNRSKITEGPVLRSFYLRKSRAGIFFTF